MLRICIEKMNSAYHPHPVPVYLDEDDRTDWPTAKIMRNKQGTYDEIIINSKTARLDDSMIEVVLQHEIAHSNPLNTELDCDAEAAHFTSPQQVLDTLLYMKKCNPKLDLEDRIEVMLKKARTLKRDRG